MLSNIIHTTKLFRSTKLIHPTKIIHTTKLIPTNTVRTYSSSPNPTEIFSELESHIDRLDKEVKKLSSTNTNLSSTINDIVKQLQRSTSTHNTQDDLRKIIQDELKVVKFTSQLTSGMIFGFFLGNILGRIFY